VVFLVFLGFAEKKGKKPWFFCQKKIFLKKLVFRHGNVEIDPKELDFC